MSFIGYSLGSLTTQYPDLLEKSNSKSLSQRQQTRSTARRNMCMMLARPWTLYWIGGDAELAKGEGNPGMEGP